MKFLRRGETLGNLRCIETLLEEAVTMVPPNYKEAIRLIMKVASLGGDTYNLMICYQNEDISKAELDTTLRAHKAANDEMKTVRRDYAKRFMKWRDDLLQ